VGTHSLGYGKTTVAGTVKEKLDVMDLDFDNPVGATFFFWRSSPERNSPARFIITLAYQLAGSIPERQPHVAKPPPCSMFLSCPLWHSFRFPIKRGDCHLRAVTNLQAVFNKHVNLVNLTEGFDGSKEIESFSSERPLSRYTRDTGKYFSSSRAAGTLLKAFKLLRKIEHLPEASSGRNEFGRIVGPRRGRGTRRQRWYQ
jgi:hypothetical protein